MKKGEGLFRFTNRRLKEIWDDNPGFSHDRFMIVMCVLIYPLTLFIAWCCQKDPA